MRIMDRRLKDGRRVQTVNYGGKVYRRYPESKRRADRLYFKNRQAYLHRVVWVDHHGPIPKGHEVHHANGDTADNRIENLECVTRSAHNARKHAWGRWPGSREHLREASRLAAKWHRSKAGRAWHREHAKQVAAARTTRELTCEWCGATFQTKDRKAATRFCSSRCRHYARKARGDDNAERTCEICGISFTHDRYSAKRCCSTGCAVVLRERKKALGRKDGE